MSSPPPVPSLFMCLIVVPLREIPFEEYIQATLDLIRELSRLNYRVGLNASEKSLKLLWLCLQDDSSAPMDVKNAALSKFQEIVADYSQKVCECTREGEWVVFKSRFWFFNDD